jgi:hypothetical protein
MYTTICQEFNNMSLTKIINRQLYLISCLSLGATLFASLQSRTLAQTTFLQKSPPTQINRLSTPQTLRIPGATQQEIFPGVQGAGGAINESVSNEQDLLRPPTQNVTLHRQIPAFWQMRVSVDQVPRLRATYVLTGEDGTTNAISNGQNSRAKVKIVLNPLPIREISRDQNSQTAVVEGGVDLILNLSQAESAGEYRGDILVTVDTKN